MGRDLVVLTGLNPDKAEALVTSFKKIEQKSED